ncbi:IS66 family transposase [Paenibacillus planticolens]|uniref:Transposase n=1 Tax=Paenibacillus planticolens TaxID=2654976 RepID=A0ABX1ZFS7_9BACL|nr:transposase [Paenibacillus planticolens]NOU98925.1 transposase [Paenibacillus planticolens]
MDPIRRIVSALEPAEDKSSSTVRKKMEAILEWLWRTYDRDTDVSMVKNVTSYTKGFWKGLFSCYDHGHLPRTNNDHERFFRQTKTRHRRMTGRRSWNEYILRNGEYVVLVDDALQQEDLTNRLSLVSYENYKQQKERWNNRLNESVLRRRFRKDPLAYLQNLENKHSMLVIPL